MKLTALRLHNVKRFADRGIAIEGIGDGVNVLSAANEQGKSTCFEALHALFFQPHTGTPGPIQLLRPYSGGSPLVEADILTDAGSYRLTKRFYSGKRATVVDLGTGQLVAQADEAEAFISDLMGGGTSGPAGLLWVRQGITGLEKRSKGEEDSDKRVRQSLLSSVQGEVEAMTGGRRMADIAARCEADLAELVTATLRPKTGGQYARAVETRDKLRDDEKRLGADVDALREALDKRRRTVARLAELQDDEEVAARKSAVDAAEGAFAAAKSHSEALRTAEAEGALAAHRAKEAAGELANFKDARTRADELGTQLDAARLHRNEVQDLRARAIAAVDVASVEVQTAEDEEREVRDLLVRLETSIRAREAADQLVELRGRLEQADAARVKVESGEAELSLLEVPGQLVEDLQELEVKLAGLRAAQTTTLPTLRMEYQDGIGDSVAIDGKLVDHEEERSFAGTVRLDISGIGALTLRSNRPIGADRAIDEAEGRRRELLTVLSSDSLAAARLRAAAARDKSADVELARQRLVDLAPKGVQQLREDVARLIELSAGAPEVEGDPQQIRAELAETSIRVTNARNAVREVQPRQAEAVEAAVRAETTLASIEAELVGLDATLGPQDQRDDREQRLLAAVTDADGRSVAAEAVAAPLRDRAIDMAGVEATLNRTRSVRDAAVEEAGRLSVALADLNGQIRTRAEDAVEEAWREATEALGAAEERVVRFETEVAVLDRLRKALAAARSASRDLYLKPVISELLPLLGLLFDDISIVFDETTLLPQTVRRNGQDEEVERLSGGMREQLSVLTRLAFARLLARDGRSAPVILDDALVYSDDDRIERMFDALHRQARDQQILVFSCRQRAFAGLGGNLLQMHDWTPT
ncbi:MAG: AAA family ATPase [Devosia sp.]|nr:AAA family ATPase [Devosia sp.]